MTRPDIAVVMGTWDRRARLEACVASLRAAADGIAHRILVADAGSVDGSREWLAEQSDCELLEGGRDGAVKAFNIAYARAVDLDPPWILQFNDDLILHGNLGDAVADLEADDAVGAVAFPSTRYTPTPSYEPTGRYHGKLYCNQGLFRRTAGMAAARFLGDPEGKHWWDPQFHTYAADTVLGLTLWRLGWEVRPTSRLWVEDDYTSNNGHLDPLRIHNSSLNDMVEEERFLARYNEPVDSDYHRADAEAFGGRLR